MTQQLPHEPIGSPTDLRSGSLDERPGALRGGATLILQTRQAERLVKGRAHSAGKPAIIGLIGYANLVRSLWHGARADDPYADWWLLKVHEALAHAERELRDIEATIAKRFESLAAIEIAPPASVKPARIALHFSNPYAFRAARLIALFDGLVRTVLCARHVGLLDRDEAERIASLASRTVRRTLQAPVGYRFLGVTRTDVANGIARALQAQAAMGAIPEDLLSGARRAPHAPAVVSPRPSAVTDANQLHTMAEIG